jgi:hypothetical protein
MNNPPPQAGEGRVGNVTASAMNGVAPSASAPTLTLPHKRGRGSETRERDMVSMAICATYCFRIASIFSCSPGVHFGKAL